jgi:secreted trypsin-like serine protease
MKSFNFITILFVLYISSLSSAKFERRVIGGKIAERGQFPFVVGVSTTFNGGLFD